MLKCARCGSLVPEDRKQCGVCGSPLLAQFQAPPTMGQVSTDHGARLRAIIVLSTALAVLASGAFLTFTPIMASLTVLGYFLMTVGAIVLLVSSGAFSGAPYKGRTGRMMNRADRELERRRRRKYAD